MAIPKKFALRTLMLLIALAALFFGWAVQFHRPSQIQHEALTTEWTDRVNPCVYFEHQLHWDSASQSYRPLETKEELESSQPFGFDGLLCHFFDKKYACDVPWQSTFFEPNLTKNEGNSSRN